MKKYLALLVCLVCVFYFSCGKGGRNIENSCPYALMHDGIIYYDTGEYIFEDVEYSEADILGKVVSVIPESRMPEKSGEANIPIEGSVYIRHELSGDGILVLIDGKWYIFETREME